MTTTDAPTSERPAPRRRRGLGQRRNVIIGIVLVAGFALGVGLVLIPDDEAPVATAPESTDETVADGPGRSSSTTRPSGRSRS